MNIILFDTETTGLLKPEPASLNQQPYITEFYGCKVNEEFQLLEELESFVKPPIPIPEEVIRISKITDEMVKNAPIFPEFYAELARFFTGVDLVVAHNLPFDLGILNNELRRINKTLKFPWPRHHACTVEKSMHLRGHRLKLAQLHEIALGKSFKDAHRAKQDVHALVRCFHWLTENNHIDLKAYEK